MRRKPSGSHCVQNTPDDRYRPSSATLAAGANLGMHDQRSRGRRLAQRQRARVQFDPTRGQRLAREFDADVTLLFAVQDQTREGVLGRCGRIAPELEPGGHPRGTGVQIERQVQRVHEERRRPIVEAAPG